MSKLRHWKRLKMKMTKTKLKILLLLLTFFVLSVSVIVYLLQDRSTELYTETAEQQQQQQQQQKQHLQQQTNYSLTKEYIDTLGYMDRFQSLLIRNSEVLHKTNGVLCTEKRNFVFIKPMKCATQTVVQILRRFGYLRNLNFVLPRGKDMYLGWPYIMDKLDYRPSKRHFNVLVDHAIYNQTVMSQLMPKDSVYITIIREPFSHFKSVFNYFNIANIALVGEEDKLSGYLQNLEKYEIFYKSPEGAKIRYCIPDGFSVTKNLLSHCLGMPLGFPKMRENITADENKILEYIYTIEEQFNLVMIMEYFHESLVLLKRQMCWSLEDIVYHSRNVGNYAFKMSNTSTFNLNIHQSWSHVDYLLYNHFNQTFWKKIQEQGEDFHREVTEFTMIQSEVSKFCLDKSGVNYLVIEESEFSSKFNVSKDLCLILDIDLLEPLKQRFDRVEEWTEAPGERDHHRKTC